MKTLDKEQYGYDPRDEVAKLRAALVEAREYILSPINWDPTTFSTEARDRILDLIRSAL